MKVGFGLPTIIPGEQVFLLPEWARQAEAAAFSSIGMIDRVVYPGLDIFTTFAALAAATREIRLVTSVLVAPLYSTVQLAKQAASLDALSRGRLTLGLGVGAREDDFIAVSASFHNRGKRFDDQIVQMKRLWTGEALSEEIGAIGPLPSQTGGPEIIIGGFSPNAIKRVGLWADGYIAGTVGPDLSNPLYRMAEASWHEAGREGKPRLMGCAYFGLGATSREQAGESVRKYYAYRGADQAHYIANLTATTAEEVRTLIQKYEEIGTDELILFAAISERGQIARLADAIGTFL